MSVTNYGSIGDANQPSPSVWGDCPKTLLKDLGLGYYGHSEFLAAPADTLAAGEQRPVVDGLSIDCDDDTVLALKASEEGGWLDVETDGDDNDAAALFTEPLGKIVKNSGQKVWLEAYVELGDVAGDQGFFLGLVEEAGASRDVLADDVGTDGVITESLIGFLVDNEDDDVVKIVYRKDNGTVVTVEDDATNATAIPSDDRANLVNDTPVKLGLRFDGKDKLHFYVNGYKVATQTVDSTIDQAKAYCAIIGLKTGAAAAESFAMDWFRFAYQARS